MKEEMQAKVGKGKEEWAKHREEDREFKQRFLAEFERHNDLIETLIAKMAALPQKSG